MQSRAQNCARALGACSKWHCSHGDKTICLDVERLLYVVGACVIHTESNDARVAACRPCWTSANKERQVRRCGMVVSRNGWSLVGKVATVAMEVKVAREEQGVMGQILLLLGMTPASIVHILQRHPM